MATHRWGYRSPNSRCDVRVVDHGGGFHTVALFDSLYGARSAAAKISLNKRLRHDDRVTIFCKGKPVETYRKGKKVA